MKPLMKLLMGITFGILLGVSVDAAVGTFTFKTTGASDTVEAVSLVYPQRVPEAGSVTNDKLAEPVSIANGGTGATTAAAGLAALGGASLNGSSTVAFNASTINGVTPLTAAEKTQALVGSPIADFAARNISAVGTQTVMVSSEGLIRTVSVTLADDAEINLATLVGKTLSCADLFTVTTTNARAACIVAYTSGSADTVTLIGGKDHSATDEDGKLCIYPAGSGVYMLKNRLAATVTFNVICNGFK